MKRIGLALCLLCLGVNAQAFDRKNINYDKDFWGTWSIYHGKTQCAENFTFSKPTQFKYAASQKKMSGSFSILSSNDALKHDLLVLNIKQDNGLKGCVESMNKMSGYKLNLTLKWISKNSALICTDREAKKCTNLYFIKKSQ